MKKIILLLWLCGVGVFLAAAETNTVFQIGSPDGNYQELAMAGHWEDYAAKFPNDVDFTVGQSVPMSDWPYILPGPEDGWAGNKIHAFKIHFQIPGTPTGYYRLIIDFVNTHAASPPELVIDVNEGQVKDQLPKGNGGDASLTDAKSGQNYSLEQLIPASQFHSGDNTIILSSDSGSWALFDDVRLESGIPAPAESSSLQATPLPFFKKTSDGMQRAVKVMINNVEWNAGPAELDWSAKGVSGSQQVNVNFGENDSMITVPDTDEVDLTLKIGGNNIHLPVTMPPAKKWRLYIVPTVHTDIGYTDLQDRVKLRHANNGMAALQMLGQYPDFKWYSETFWQFDMLALFHPDMLDQAFDLMRENRWELSADYANMLTGLCSSEALDRLTLDSREMAARGHFKLETDILDDVPSAVGSLPMVLANSGIKYFIEGANNDRAPYAGQVPNPFWWEGVDGSRVLAEITTKPGYGGANSLLPNMKRAMEQLPPYLDRFQTNSDYPYDAVLINGAYSDNRPVLDWLPQMVNQWNSEWAYPKMIMAQPEDYYGYILKNFSGSIPVLKTDFGDWWSDGAGSAAYETALSRRAEERAVTAEILHSLASIMTGAEYPQTNFDDLWHNILLYNEHTWGAAGSISSPHSMQTLKQWEVKASYAHISDAESRDLLDSGMKELAGMVPASDLVVFNPLAWSRNAVVKVDAVLPVVQDVKSQKILPCQPLPEGGSCFIANDLPAVGYRCYQPAAIPDMVSRAVQISGNQMENEFYRVTLNPQTGGIQSIYDKQLGRELLDANSQYNLGELIYVTGGLGTYAIHSDLAHLPPPHFEYHPQTGVKIESTNGPVFGELDSEATADDFPKITMRVRLYRGIKQLDLIFELDKTETLNKEAAYLAFPFAQDPRQGGLWLDYPDEITQPLKDQHASACRDWYAVQRWLAVSDGNATVELSSLDAPLFTLGQMTASTWPTEIPLDRGHVFGYIMNNYWHTNYKASQGGHFVFRYSITSNAGGFSAHDAVVDGWNMYCPAVAASGQGDHQALFPDAAGSLVGVSPDGLALTTIKEAEDGSGFVFRTCDYTGEGGKLELTLPRRAHKVVKCDLVETELGKVPAHGKIVTAPIKPFAPMTLKVEFPSP